MSDAASQTPKDSEESAELNAIVQAVRDRVRARYPEPGEYSGPAEAEAESNGTGGANGNPGNSGPRKPPVQVQIADLMPLVHARDAAQAKIAAIGSVNPRAGGLINKIIQWVKKTIARALQWFVRDQVAFNRETVASLETVIEALNDHNRALISLAGQTNEQVAGIYNDIAGVYTEIEKRTRELLKADEARTRELLGTIEARTREFAGALDERTRELLGTIKARTREFAGALDARTGELHRHLEQLEARDVELEAAVGARIQEIQAVCDRLEPEIQGLRDMHKHLVQLRGDWEHRIGMNEIQFLRSVADFQGAFQLRTSQMESNFREIVKAQHADYLGALDRTNVAIQKQLWLDFQKVRAEYGQMIHDELRIIRLRQKTAPANDQVIRQPVEFGSTQPIAPALDYTRFAFRFRGSEESVRRAEEFYRPFFANCRSVLDIGCGRGEFLELMRDMGIAAKGIDLGGESVAQCRDKGLEAETADLFAYLGPETQGEFDGIFASQIVEHIDPARLPEMIRLCASSLRRGGVLAIETPNPDCLAIFATYFYLDPTHMRPVPRQLMEFYMDEAGMGSIEVHELSPAVESIPEIMELPEKFRERFFGGLDYAIIGRKL